ncbi:hypothetical protein [Poseidonocella sp. HB161398]|uniref:hypothetical protein n=1 Tax=Poseidonocella sp. HB161398 TaxID=2320855 RepID=UPI001485D9BA|nr:hypothetical protein [Poseidonocella sp. HB161398]
MDRDSLPVSQRCSFETNGHARGFDYALVTGDRCLAGRAERAVALEPPRGSGAEMCFT